MVTLSNVQHLNLLFVIKMCMQFNPFQISVDGPIQCDEVEDLATAGSISVKGRWLRSILLKMSCLAIE